MRMLPAAVVALLAPLGLLGCGGAGFVPGSVTVAILSTASLDGTVSSAPAVVAGDVLAAVGDEAANLVARGFLSFPLASIPPGAIILGARLEVVQVGVSGTPYADLGNLVVDHLDYGATLDQGDLNLIAFDSAFGVLSNSPTLELKTMDVTPQVVIDRVALRSQSQVRVRFGADTDGNNDIDSVSLATHEAGSNRPVLRITYLP